MFYLVIIICLTVVDQITKFIAMSSPGLGGQSEIIANFLYINVIRNNGIAFGMLKNAQSVVIALTAFLMGAIMIYILLKQKEERKRVLIPLAMIAGGAFGNLIDRIARGAVIDFIDVHIWPFIFNFADICVVFGCILLLLSVLFPSMASRRKK